MACSSSQDIGDLRRKAAHTAPLHQSHATALSNLTSADVSSSKSCSQKRCESSRPRAQINRHLAIFRTWAPRVEGGAIGLSPRHGSTLPVVGARASARRCLRSLRTSHLPLPLLFLLGRGRHQDFGAACCWLVAPVLLRYHSDVDPDPLRVIPSNTGATSSWVAGREPSVWA